MRKFVPASSLCLSFADRNKPISLTKLVSRTILSTSYHLVCTASAPPHIRTVTSRYRKLHLETATRTVLHLT